MSGPKILLQDSYYPSALRHFDREVAGALTYDDLLRRMMALRFGVSDAMSTRFRHLGWQTADVVTNSLRLQRQWSREHGIPIIPWLWSYPYQVRETPVLRGLTRSRRYVQGIFLEQVRRFQPDVLYLHDAGLFTSSQIDEMRLSCRIVAFQTGGPFPDLNQTGPPDVFISPLPSHTARAASLGISSHTVPMAFDQRVIAGETPCRDIDVSFVGSVSDSHPTTLTLLRSVARSCPELQIYGPPSPPVLSDDLLRQCYRGEAWGREMYAVLRRSRVTLNRHVNWAGPHAANMRLFEATGCGATLVTDLKEDLDQLFEPGAEVLTYCEPSAAGDIVREILDDPDRGQQIASAGQRRTLRDHTYDARVPMLSEILASALGL